MPAKKSDDKIVKNGDKIKVHYTGTLDDGTQFDTSEGREPLEFEVGSGQLIQGFDTAVVGMKVGDEKNIKLKPEQAYGQPNPELLQKLPFTKRPDFDPKPGQVLTLQDPMGRVIRAFIKEVGEDSITVDLNHPLAGKSLNFRIKVVDIV
ncbi:MAG: peptidylprolyl isomerase [Candidatus Woesearchaeota archaeon]